MPTEQNITKIMEILACPECKSDVDLVLGPNALDDLPRLEMALATNMKVDSYLKCSSCGRTFPITEDSIPVMWSDSLRQAFLSLSIASIPDKPNETAVKTANIKVYDAIVGDYDAVGIHADKVTCDRMLSAFRVARISPDTLSGWHLDVGCGGGNILQMAHKNTGLEHFVGIDVSLAALRMVMKRGYLAVIGDAELLPIKSSCATLITSSSVLHHLFRPQQLICEAQRVLTNEGLFFTDFDPNRIAADWSWLVRIAYNIRPIIYRFLNSLRPTKRVSHKNADIQRWNSVAEFHNRPGAGFSVEEISRWLNHAGLVVRLVFIHTTLDHHVTAGKFVRPNRRHLVTQILSGRNPFNRQNGDTILTLSQKTPAETSL